MKEIDLDFLLVGKEHWICYKF